ncbi:SRPBCC family protein [Bailinhaonella thermotolerans]|uniref:SRPBCC family protein n=1 Tax=Bailinhaonella thermotolerans TaxID=1070861 RepID=A0A3A4AQN5_9ACTN|nr:SRPBCC family protein [Bailinhaonella thermotolerans]RJL32056.1 SRPBCC family protein [Bailinhaonella thermotolerans]
MSTIEHSVDVRVPIRTAYNQWTQFESFPEFMEGVESVKQITNTRTAWIAEIAGVRREFEAEITEQHPDERVAWRTVEAPHHAGVVTFHRLDEDTTRVMLQMEYDPEGFMEKAADALQIVRRRVKGDLERFKEFIERRGGETGAWRGDVPGGHQRGSYETGTAGTGTAYEAGTGTTAGTVYPEPGISGTPPVPPPGPGPVPPPGQMPRPGDPEPPRV